MADEIKIGQELIDISKRIDNSKGTFDEATTLYSNIMDVICSQYKGKALDNVELFYKSELAQLQKLSEMYEKTSYFVMYALKQMNFTDVQLSQMMKEEIQTGDGK